MVCSICFQHQSAAIQSSILNMPVEMDGCLTLLLGIFDFCKQSAVDFLGSFTGFLMKRRAMQFNGEYL